MQTEIMQPAPVLSRHFSSRNLTSAQMDNAIHGYTDKLRNRRSALLASCGKQERKEYQQILRRLYVLVKKRAQTEPLRMLGPTTQLLRHTIGMPAAQTCFGLLWKKLMHTYEDIHGAGTSRTEIDRQLELFDLAQTKLGGLTRGPAPFVAIAKSLIQSSWQAGQKGPASPLTCTSSANVLARPAP